MATVITNLLSAIPIFGQDIVELIYVTKFCTFFGSEIFILTFSSCVISCVPRNSGVKEGNESIFSVLPSVGTVSIQALKKGNKIRLDTKDYLLIPYQFISFLVGLIDADGYIQITKTTKGFIAIKLILGLSIEDISTLEYIHSILKLGKIIINRDLKRPYCKLIINKTGLQEVLFPLLIHHEIFFLTETRRAQFDRAILIFRNNVKLYDQISNNKEILSIFKLPETSSDYLKLNFFKNWLVGFTNAEGSFFIKKNNDGCFQLKQRIHVQLFEAFKLFFKTNRNISIEKNKYLQFSVCSKTDIQTVINFFSFSGTHPLIGLKSIEYFKWLTILQNSYRYRNLNFPQ